MEVSMYTNMELKYNRINQSYKINYNLLLNLIL